jgi:phosphocarrier protein FPr
VVGLVIVSHSAKLAEGAAELAAQMAGPDLRIGAAGGLDEPGALGTDATRVLAAIEDVWSDDGVLVLMDLGSAVLSAELALDLLGDERRGKVLLSAAPLVEGAVAAAVTAGLGEPLDRVAAAARDGLAGKTAQLGEEAAASGVSSAPAPAEAAAPDHAPGPREPEARQRVTVRNRLGLHARPAALLVRTLASFDASVGLSVPATGKGPADARSLTAVGALGVRCGDELVAGAAGPQAAEALEAFRRLADEGFGEPGDLVAPATHGAPNTEVPQTEQPGAASAGPVTAACGPPAAGAVLAGLRAAAGLAVGPALRLRHAAPSLAAIPAGDPAAEWSALEAALSATAEDLRRSRAAVAGRDASAAAVFDAHLLLLEDPGLLDPVREEVFAAGEPASRAWAAAIDRAATTWDRLPDPYQRARAGDVRQVGDQVLRHLASGAAATASADGERAATGEPTDGASREPAEPAVIVTDELTPADVAAFAPGAVAGVACAAGGPASHAVILARALGLPVVVGAGAALLAVADGTPLVVDGDAGTVTVSPPADVVTAALRGRQERAREAAVAASRAAGPAVTRDGVTVPVAANVSLPEEARAAVAAGADGVGLLRTEFLFLGAAVMPGEDEQAAAYETIAAALDGRPLTIRTLDAGADKPLPYLPLPPENNPFLGVRGLRLSLLHPDQLRCQLRAVLRVAAAHPVRVMFPMVAEADELKQALVLLDEAREALVGRGAAVPEHLEPGVMLEVPSAALLAERIAPLASFFSVGTNDLTQYTLAAERGNAGVAALADPLHPAVLRLIAHACEAADAAGRTVAVCGEVAGEPSAVPLLLGLGVHELSMSPVRIAAAKQAVRRTDLAAARALARRALAADSAAAVRRLLAAPPPAG